MGSRTKRKENDQPIIRVPQISGVEQIKGKPEQAFDICKVSFDVQISNRAFAVKNAPVLLVFKRINLYYPSGWNGNRKVD